MGSHFLSLAEVGDAKWSLLVDWRMADQASWAYLLSNVSEESQARVSRLVELASVREMWLTWLLELDRVNLVLQPVWRRVHQVRLRR